MDNRVIAMVGLLDHPGLAQCFRVVAGIQLKT